MALVVMAAPVAVAAWLFAASLDARDRDRVDARIAASLHAAEVQLAGRLSAAATAARRLASRQDVQRALLRDDARSLSRIARPLPAVAFYAHGRWVAGRRATAELTRTVAVARRGRPIGRVIVAVPLTGTLLTRLGRSQDVRFLIERHGLVVAGLGFGASVRLTAGRSQTIRLGGASYRTLSTALPGRDALLAAASPAAPLDAAASSRARDVALAALASLLTLVLVVSSVGPSLLRLLRRRRAQEDEEGLQLLGAALVAAYDRDALLPVILETMIDATDAVGGVLLDDDREVARFGQIPAFTQPLRLDLAAERRGQATIYLYPGFGGFDESARRRAKRLAAHTWIALENARQHALARRQAVTDPLTGLTNRRRFMEQLVAETRRAGRYGHALSVVLADLDDFKQLNDTFGHALGDDVLRAFADVLRESVRDVDLPARFGGEEFAILLPETEIDGAATVAQRFRQGLKQLRVPGPEGTELRVTASFGIAASTPTTSSEDLLAAADAALYRAKRAGKDRVEEAAA